MNAALVKAADLVDLTDLVDRVRPVSLAGEQVLAVTPELGALLPHGGLRRGTVVEVDSAALLFALLATPTQNGSWAACVGAKTLGWAAAAEMGVALERVAVIGSATGQPLGRSVAGSVLAALVDALDIVVIDATVMASIRPVDARRLTARARERGAVLAAFGRGWPDPVDLRCRVVSEQWEGLGQGWGNLSGRRCEVLVDGRGAAARPRRGWVQLAGPSLMEMPEDQSVHTRGSNHASDDSHARALVS